MAENTNQLPGYELSEEIYCGTRTLVYRGMRAQDQKPVIIKLMRQEYPSFNELVQFRNQYTIGKNLDLAGIIKFYSLENYCNACALIMEDFGGVSLKDYITNVETLHATSLHFGTFLQEFFHIAIQIVTALEGLHRNRIIHKDIKPANILINPQTKQVKLIDFSIASLLPRESATLMSSNVLEGTLAYLSPEQTGRMNRGIDYRSDFYSVGVTFFELLTGRLPFSGTDPMELIHCHIAKLPPRADSINPNIPLVLSQIIYKLMAKTAEERYQSALGLRYDLEACLHKLETLGTIDTFELGKRDISERFIIPEKLYGREAKVETLLAAFERVSTQQTEMMLVSGYSGIGKSALVNEVHKPIVRQRGYFIRGKFDQFGRSIPLDAIVQAFRDLMGQLLSESIEQVEQWKAKILQAVGEQGRVIIDVIPEVELLIGKQPAVLELEPTAGQNRFNLVFQKFIQVFTNATHPLVMFLDDLQWADLASLKLIQLLMSESETRHLLLIGAYRDNEVSGAHPLMLTIEEIRKTGAVVNTITLTPLTQTDLNRLIADTLNCQEELAKPLTQLVYTKTKGNPFFSNQFLKVLHEDGLITFNCDAGYWQCDLSQVRALSLTDDVVDFMALQLQKLPEHTQNVLKLAACIGNLFDLETLAVVHEKSPGETANDLWKALQEGLILPTSEIYKFFVDETSNSQIRSSNCHERLAISNEQLATYKFLHDRVQQAAYSLIPENQKQSTHLKIGQLLLCNTPREEREAKVFDIVNHHNVGVELITNQIQRDELAQLNLIAGRKAKTSTAYADAVKYLTTGIQLLACDCWKSNYKLTLALYETAAEAAYLFGDFEQMEQLAELVQNRAHSLLDQVKVYEVKIEAYKAQNRGVEAIKTGLQVLKLLGIEVYEQPSQEDVEIELQNTQLALAERKIEDLIDLPQMTETEKLAAMNILWRLISITYISNPLLFMLVVFKQVNLCLKYGNCTSSAISYLTYGIILWNILGDINSNYYLGQLSLKLLTKFNAKVQKPMVIFVVNNCTIHWKEHLIKSLKYLSEAYSLGLETGDLENAAYSACMYCEHSFWVGKNLIEIERKIAKYHEVISQLKQEIPLQLIAISWQVVFNLLKCSEEPCFLRGKAYDEQIMLPLHEHAGNRLVIFHVYLQKLFLSYLFEDYPLAWQNAILAESFSDTVPAKFVVAVFYFYSSLAILAAYPEANQSAQEEILKKISDSQTRMQKWAEHAPMNFLHKYYLVSAERHRVLGENLAAIEMYERAIALAKEHEYINEEALAYELAAKFYLSWDKELIAQTYMVKAYSGYNRWGALAKVENLKQRYPQLLTHILQREKIILNSNDTVATVTSGSLPTANAQTTSVSCSISDSLDLATVMKAGLALSGEIQLDKLLSTLMQVMIENAGAQKGCLILCQGDCLAIEAQAVCSKSDTQALEITCLQSIPVHSSHEIPVSVIKYVWRTWETLVFDDATAEKTFAADPYIIVCQPKSVLCTPLCNQGKLIGILYLENNLILGAFTHDRLKVLNLLATQAAISLENAMLYYNLAVANERLEDYSRTLEQKVAQRTQELNEKNQHLEKTLEELQRTQSQLIQTEKMSSLGQMVAGVAHEINNPINFIYGNIVHANEYVQDLLDLLAIYQQEYPNPTSKVVEKTEEIELNFLVEDLFQLLNSMKVGSHRIRNIVLGLRNFSRLDEAEMKPVDIHEGIDSTLMILQHRLKTSLCSDIEIIKEYGQLPQVTCYAGQLNQVFMNILNNAIDALHESAIKITNFTAKIRINTGLTNNHMVKIVISDNGSGMTEEVKQKIFDPFFTTKPVGSGTGLGLSISYQIIVDKHKGKLACSSLPEEGTEFIIEIPMQ
jgi:predicted ATPase/signal transduction histidine kinase/tRNA A-37 threonylcarbamoyl transferase component Bud32